MVPFVEREKIRLKLTFWKDTYDKSLDEIDRANMFLRRCLSQSVQLEPSRRRRQAKSILSNLRSIQQHATSLYNTTFDASYWKCCCRQSHVASLRLQSQGEYCPQEPKFQLREYARQTGDSSTFPRSRSHRWHKSNTQKGNRWAH